MATHDPAFFYPLYFTPLNEQVRFSHIAAPSEGLTTPEGIGSP